MKTRHPITVEGVILDEYLRDNESIENEIKSKEFIKDGFDRIDINRHIREKYADHKEKNGRVKILGQKEINKANSNRYLEEALKSKNFRKAFFIAAVSTERKGYLKVSDVADEVFAFVREKNLDIEEKFLRHAMRGALGYLRKSKFKKFMEHHERNTDFNRLNVAIFKIKEEGKEMPFENSIPLALKIDSEYLNKLGRKSKKLDDKKVIKRKDILLKSKGDEIDIVKTDSKIKEISEIMSKVVESINKIGNENGPLVKFEGDLVININIGSKGN